MNSKSSTNFRWSVRLTDDDDDDWYIGIASKLEQKDDYIENYDKNSIFFSPSTSQIYKGSLLGLPSNITNATSGDEFHFKFQPKLKKYSNDDLEIFVERTTSIIKTAENKIGDWNKYDH